MITWRARFLADGAGLQRVNPLGDLDDRAVYFFGPGDRRSFAKRDFMFEYSEWMTLSGN